VNAVVDPTLIDGVGVEMVNEVSTGVDVDVDAETVINAVAVSEPEVPVMVDVPAANAVNTPVASIVPTDVFELVQFTEVAKAAPY